MRILFALLLVGLMVFPVLAEDFGTWLTSLRAEALAHDISSATLDVALAGVTQLDRVIELDRNQPEFTLRLDDYLSRYASGSRVDRGRQLMRQHREMLEQIGSRYGVQPRYLVALWGIESNYGRNTGSFRVIDSLATLAFDGRRAEFFRGELLDALKILDEGHIDPSRMLGSWSGAMGQPQFMPSSFRTFAVDFNGDGRRDIWDTREDVLASAANYLSRYGWHDDQTWGRRVQLPPGFDGKLIGRSTKKTLAQWQALRVRRAGGGDLPTRQLSASLVRPDDRGATYLVYDNYRTLLRWNRSEYFGIAVGILSDRIDQR